MLAGYAVAKSFRVPAKWVTAPVAVLLAEWTVMDSGLARPDYIAYFNQLAGSHPERITVESDAGQDAHLLGQVLKELAAQQVELRIKTTARLDQEGLTEVLEVPPSKK